VKGLFLFQWIPFIYFSSVITVTGTSKAMLNNTGKSGHPFLVSVLRGNALNFTPLRIIFAVGLPYMAFIMLSYVSSVITVTDSIDMSLSKFQKMVKDREAWCAVVHGATKSWT